MTPNEPNDFEKTQGDKQSSLLGEFFQFLKASRKYWLVPLIIALLAMAALIILGGTAAAPFIYTLF